MSLERAIVNLINNAIKFTPEGGAVRVLARPDGGVTIEVADNGAGIEPQDLPRVFERFYKADRARRAGGTGLGLAVVKHTAEAHGGRVEAESRLGEGSTFRIWLPRPRRSRTSRGASRPQLSMERLRDRIVRREARLARPRLREDDPVDSALR